MLQADNIKNSSETTCIDGKWVAMRCLPFYGWYGFVIRLKDAWQVLKGKADAVKYYKQ